MKYWVLWVALVMMWACGSESNSFDCESCKPPFVCDEQGKSCVFDCSTCLPPLFCNASGTACEEIAACQQGLVSARCLCGEAVVDSGYCCAGQAQDTACVEACAFGAIELPCECDGQVRDVGEILSKVVFEHMSASFKDPFQAAASLSTPSTNWTPSMTLAMRA